MLDNQGGKVEKQQERSRNGALLEIAAKEDERTRKGLGKEMAKWLRVGLIRNRQDYGAVAPEH
jgi:hypothetical protein